MLRPIGDDIRGRTLTDINRPHIDFPRSRTIHFARFAILDDPNRGPERKRLLYSSNYDGDLDDHLAELVAITSDLDTIWGHCEGYAGAARFGAFIRAHAREPEAFYIAFRDDAVERIRQVIALRQRVQSLLDAAPGGSLAAILCGMSFLLRQREHQESVRVRAADLVQQPSLRGPQRQQGSDSR